MKINKIIIFIFSIVIAYSCDDYLEITPSTEVTDGSFYSSEEEMFEALVACYDVLQWENTKDRLHMEWMFGDMPSDDAVKGGSSVSTFEEDLLPMDDFTINSSNKHLDGVWSACYQGIYRCNLFLEKAEVFEGSEDLISLYKAEAKFLRAYFYFSLANIFGGVPLVDKSLSPEADFIARSTKSEIYDFIEGDLRFAADLCKRKSSIATGRITKGAALGLLTKVLVYHEKWPEAKLVAEEFLALNEYTLDPDYVNIFSMNGEFGSGSVFEINFLTTNDTNSENLWWWNGTEGSMLAAWISPTNDNGKGYCQATQDFVDEFETDDPRLLATITPLQTEGVGIGTGYFNQKFMYSDNNPYPAGSLWPLTMSGVNKRILRLADVYLLYAEICANSGAEDLARDYLNMVRLRARNGNAAILPNIGSGVTGVALMDAIQHERRVELGFESQRFYDLVRWGKAGEKLAGFNVGVNEVWPIPFEEVQKTGGVVTQNNGYN